MMCLPASLGAIARAGGSVSFVAATGASYIDSGTTINTPSTPAGVQAGDGLFAIVFARSALTPPSGWTLVNSQLFTAATTDQTLYIYRRDSAGSSDSSTAFAWTQASSNRMGLAYVLVRSSTGALTVAQSLKRADSVAESGGVISIPVPTPTAAADGELVLAACSTINAATTPTTTTWTAPSGMTLRTTATLNQNRMAVATQARSAGQSSSTPFTQTNSGTNLSTGAIAMRLAPA